ncbi:leader peptidase (prepilin peptidase)/N-methyltransferase [Streptosporangium album]|uniref:Leader peptidase (Prepilin peptidase)/N-methyltransferase n=1 Tax=Streptosporangium album TaxID=47479 RepID=A0A7W7RQJ3_9ACTN|nr:A24 family peptidase [Streptosporangium album]MBB4935813.1 leader peptidase (prepilin peptidase)/N-methyltransferase [Streptosporangium album]
MTLLPALAALTGLVAGFWTRGLVIRHSVAGSEPLRSECPRCGSPLPVAERRGRVEGAGPRGRRRGRFAWAGPLSAARCPGCRGRIGPPPLAVEVVTALVLAALALLALPSPRPGVTPAGQHPGLLPDVASAGELAAYGWLAVVTVALVFVDAAVHRLPDRLTLSAYLGTAALLTVTALSGGRFDDLLRAGLGGLALAAFYLTLFLINPAGMGLGDVKFAAALGTALGWLGWDTLVAGAFLGFVAGGLYGVALVILRRAGRKSEIPFGPFMAVGAFAAILAGL